MALVERKIDEQGVALLTLNDPDRRNALSQAMVGDIVSTFDWLEREREARAVVITGAGDAFCAGADLNALAGASQASLRDIYEGFLRIAESPLPVVAAVNGAAVGAGVNMALVADVILMAESAVIDTGFVRLALHPGGGHTWMLRHLVGPQATAAMVIFGERVDGVRAERIGLAWKCYTDGELLPAAIALAARGAAVPGELVGRIKQTISEMHTVATHEEAVDKELLDQIWSTTQPEFRERLAALQQQITSH
ncbi:MAG: enoyl-CoA hydratase/isomerase family protein [Actinobacteria bacterium]|nr:enoyl-CoA hydratase/isomerase family protein [Actinomycetota bacterium]